VSPREAALEAIAAAAIDWRMSRTSGDDLIAVVDLNRPALVDEPHIRAVEHGDTQRLVCRCGWTSPLMRVGHHLAGSLATAHQRRCELTSLAMAGGGSRG